MASVEDLAGLIVEKARAAERYIVAVAGAPGAGKSTVSHALADRLPDSMVLDGDGFHYDDMLLDQLGRRHRKGAPDTFDCRGLEVTLSRIRAGEDNVVVPVFDREIEIARGGARMIRRAASPILVEGNYLAVDRAPWSALRRYFDFVVFIDIPRDILERRLIRRWTDLGKSEAAARAWVDGNDLPNVDFVRANTGGCDFIWQPDPPGMAQA